jgi:hypothetical protein
MGLELYGFKRVSANSTPPDDVQAMQEKRKEQEEVAMEAMKEQQAARAAAALMQQTLGKKDGGKKRAFSQSANAIRKRIAYAKIAKKNKPREKSAMDAEKAAERSAPPPCDIEGETHYTDSRGRKRKRKRVRTRVEQCANVNPRTGSSSLHHCGPTLPREVVFPKDSTTKYAVFEGIYSR